MGVVQALVVVALIIVAFGSTSVAIIVAGMALSGFALIICAIGRRGPLV